MEIDDEMTTRRFSMASHPASLPLKKALLPTSPIHPYPHSPFTHHAHTYVTSVTSTQPQPQPQTHIPTRQYRRFKHTKPNKRRKILLRLSSNTIHKKLCCQLHQQHDIP